MRHGRPGVPREPSPLERHVLDLAGIDLIHPPQLLRGDGDLPLRMRAHRRGDPPRPPGPSHRHHSFRSGHRLHRTATFLLHHGDLRRRRGNLRRRRGNLRRGSGNLRRGPRTRLLLLHHSRFRPGAPLHRRCHLSLANSLLGRRGRNRLPGSPGAFGRSTSTSTSTSTSLTGRRRTGALLPGGARTAGLGRRLLLRNPSGDPRLRSRRPRRLGRGFDGLGTATSGGHSATGNRSPSGRGGSHRCLFGSGHRGVPPCE